MPPATPVCESEEASGNLLLRAAQLCKSYNVPVLRDFDFELRRGEVHALVGSNGAGKSTFARILSGLTPRNSGEIELLGKAYTPREKRDAEQAGVVMVPQELTVIGSLSIAENIFLNHLPRRAGWVRFKDLHKQARSALSRVGLSNLDPSAPAALLGVGQQQLVEIAGALWRDCRVLILDEPTAALTNPEIERLFANIRRLQNEGVGIIYISHRMDEIRGIANRVTVMRDGRRIATHQANETTAAELVREMAGHDLPERKTSAGRRMGEVALRVKNLQAGDRVRDVSFDVRRGEILGIAGLIGAGRTDTLRAIFGAYRLDDGEVWIGNRRANFRNPKDAVKAGLGLVTEDRKQDGLLLSQSVRVNTTLSSVGRHANGSGWLNAEAETETTTKFCKRLQVRCDSTEQSVSELSGGNQQKIVMARWLACDCDVLLFDEPTRGIDVAAKDAIYQLLQELADAGKAVVLVSSELVELMLLSDRILVLSLGRVTGEFTPGAWTQEKITQASFEGHLESSRAA